MYNEAKSNQVTIIGEIVSGFRFNHELYGEKFYMVDVQVSRLSESKDVIPVMVSDRLLNVSAECIGALVQVTGQFRSYNKIGELRKHLFLFVFARDMEIVEEVKSGIESNLVCLEGYICKEPIYRKTPLGREITDILLAVNRPYGKSDYIPCICWGRGARYAKDFKIGERYAIQGRIQSREYTKKVSEELTETKIAYEVSVSRLEAR